MQLLKCVKEAQQLKGIRVTFSFFTFKYTKKCLLFFQLLKKNKEYTWSEEYEKAFQFIKEYMGK